MEEKIKNKVGVEWEMKCGKCKQNCGEVKNVRENYCTNLCAMPLRLTGVRDVYLAGEIIVQRGTSPLRVVAIHL